jgi:large subunit ribosomal protein L29
MSDLNLADVRKSSDAELLDLISDKRIELFNLRFQQASGQLENTNLLRFAKRDLARLLTIKRERELGGSNG